MTRPDDELVRRYQEASAQEDARPGAHVRDAVRAHAQMLAAAAATAPSPSAHASTPSRRQPIALEAIGPGHRGFGGPDGFVDAAV